MRAAGIGATRPNVWEGSGRMPATPRRTRGAPSREFMSMSMCSGVEEVQMVGEPEFWEAQASSASRGVLPQA